MRGNVPYRSELVKTWFQYDVTINDSIRTYAEQNVMPQYPAIDQLRGALKSLFPDFNDKDWTDEFTAKIKMDDRGAKGGKPLFGAYYAIRTKALDQTITYLKQWAEDEMRAKKDYEAEVQRLRDELLKLESELKVGTPRYGMPTNPSRPIRESSKMSGSRKASPSRNSESTNTT